jgi:hypothetical protein
VQGPSQGGQSGGGGSEPRGIREARFPQHRGVDAAAAETPGATRQGVFERGSLLRPASAIRVDIGGECSNAEGGARVYNQQASIRQRGVAQQGKPWSMRSEITRHAETALPFF